jgi:2-isopropylmalate synthase
MDVLQPTAENPIIFNLPATVEAATPNVYADQIEYFATHIRGREKILISLHTHNDRGTGVAAAELGLLAGADRVEGCLFGNGERTGNTCLVTLALNMYTQGLSPGLDFSDLDRVISTVEHCNQLPVHPRHPYGGELVHTAFSGSHQDAIKKGFAAQAARNDQLWQVPYLPIDPADIGRSYEAVIRVNSQSGKGGAAWVLEQDHGLKLPKKMQAALAPHVQALADESGRELVSADILAVFEQTFLDSADTPSGTKRFTLIDWQETHAGSDRIFTGTVAVDGGETRLSGRGNGLLSSIIAALTEAGGPDLDIVDYSEHAIGSGSATRAAAYVECRTADGRSVWGAGVDPDVATASVRAVISAANRA